MKEKFIKTIALVIVICFFTGCLNEQVNTEIAEVNLYNSKDDNVYTKVQTNNSLETPVFLQFYDWFNENSWIENEFVDKLDWEAIGITGDDRSSEEFYYKQFEYIKSLGVDAISWEFHPRVGAESSYPSKEAIKAIERSGLKIAPFFDYEMTIKAKTASQDDKIATLSTSGNIKADEETVNFITSNLKDFYDKVPKELLAEDKKGRDVIFVFGYDFDDSQKDANAYNNFAKLLIENTKELCNGKPVFYWTAKNSPFLEFLYQHYSNNFVPFQFVLDTPQSQFSHDSVTWNFGFDNLGVAKRDNLQRVIRLDQRYIKEMGWLSKATDPSLIYIYSWNEPFEGSILLPTEQWGDTKAMLAKEFISRMKNGEDKILKKTLLIVDDLSEGYNKDDWHYIIEEELLLYTMRRFIPQSDVIINKNVTDEILDKYEAIVDISVQKSKELNDKLLLRMDSKQIMLVDPMAGYRDNSVASHFVQIGSQINVNRNIKIDNSREKVFIRDDINDCVLNDSSKSTGLDVNIKGKKIPLVVQNEDDIWINTYNADEVVFTNAFEVFYNTNMNSSVMYGEGLASQRLEIEAETGKITKNTLNKNSINSHWEIPDYINWFVMPPEVDEKYYEFIFGIENINNN